MKNLILAFMSFLIFTSCKSQNVNTDSFISKTCLAELISSNDEIECFSYYFDIKPEIIRENLNAYRVVYASELRDKGWNPTSPFNLINFKVPFDQNGYIISWEEFKKIHSIDNDTPEKRTYHYEIED